MKAKIKIKIKMKIKTKKIFLTLAPFTHNMPASLMLILLFDMAFCVIKTTLKRLFLRRLVPLTV
jgi:hypothetical protein